MFAALTVPGFEFDRSDAPDSLRFVGPLPLRQPSDWSPPEWWDDLNDDRPVIVVTQGTLSNQDLSQLIEPALVALANRDALVIAALGRRADALAIDIPRNARVVDFVPFGKLVSKADLLITNGGFGATQHSLAAGLPVIVAGTTEDKPATAARVAAHGLGIDLGTDTPTAEQIAEATTNAIGNPQIRENVRSIGESYSRHRAVEEIERLLPGK